MTLGDPGHSEEHLRLERALEVAGLGEFEWDMAAGVWSRDGTPSRAATRARIATCICGSSLAMRAVFSA